MAITWHVIAAEITISVGVNDKFALEINGTSTFITTLTPGTYYIYGDGSDSADVAEAVVNEDFCGMLQEILTSEAAFPGNYTVSYQSNSTTGENTGRVTITTDSTSFKMAPDHSTSTFDFSLIGFPSTRSVSFATSQVSSLSPSATWCGNQPPEKVYPVGEFNPGVHHNELPDGTDEVFVTSQPHEVRMLGLGKIEVGRVWISATDGDPGKAYQNFYRNFLAYGKRFRLYETNTLSWSTHDAADLVGRFSPKPDSTGTFEPTTRIGIPLYSWTLTGRTS